MNLRLIGAVSAAFALLCASAASADNYSVKDSGGATQTMGAKLNGGVLYPQHTVVDSTGADATDTTNHAVKMNCVAGCTNGAVTAGSGAYAAGSLAAGAIVDIGTGSSPGANTTNGILKAINTTLGTPAQAGTTGVDVSVTPTIQNAAYASGNCMDGFKTVALGITQSVLSQISLASQGGLATAKQIYVFSANPSGSTCTDKSTFTIATADLSKLIWTGLITPAAPTGTTKTWGSASGLALGIPSGGTIYVAIVETATETPASTTDLVLTFSGF